MAEGTTGYKETVWNDLPNYECEAEDCEFSTLNKKEIEEHVRFHDVVPAPKKVEAEESAKPATTASTRGRGVSAGE